MMDIDKMEAGPKMDATIAELMGWKVHHHPLDDKDFYLPEGKDPEWSDFDYYVDEWQPSTDISAAWLVEERIAELGLIEEYCYQLIAIANAHLGRDYYRQPQRWQLIHATPEDRCRAAWKAING